VEQILPDATGTKGGQILDAAGRLVNFTTKGAAATKQLKTLEGTLLANTPKFSGPTSDRDVIVYQQAVGDLANPSLPVAERQAALVQVKNMADLALQQSHARTTAYNKRAVSPDHMVDLPVMPGVSPPAAPAAPTGGSAPVGKPAPEGANQVIGGVKYVKRNGQWFQE
jgi:hypothetical protein